MEFCEIEVFNLARTMVDRGEVDRWMKRIGAEEFQVPDEEAVTDPALLIALAAKNCYRSFQPGLNPNVTKVRKDMVEYLDNVMSQGHGSVLEHSCFTFAIEGISRVATAELNRHRAGIGISEMSMRYVRFDNMRAWKPRSIDVPDDDLFNLATAQEAGPQPSVTVKKIQTEQVIRRAFESAERSYRELQSIWSDELSPESKFAEKKKVTSLMRRIVPMGIATSGVWTFNLRAMRHVLALRASAAAEEEIAYVFGLIGKVMHEKVPEIFGDFTQTPEGYWVPRYHKI